MDNRDRRSTNGVNGLGTGDTRSGQALHRSPCVRLRRGGCPLYGFDDVWSTPVQGNISTFAVSHSPRSHGRRAVRARAFSIDAQKMCTLYLFCVTRPQTTTPKTTVSGHSFEHVRVVPRLEDPSELEKQQGGTLCPFLRGFSSRVPVRFVSPCVGE